MLRIPSRRKNRTESPFGKTFEILRMAETTPGSKLEAAFAIFGKLPIPQYA